MIDQGRIGYKSTVISIYLAPNMNYKHQMYLCGPCILSLAYRLPTSDESSILKDRKRFQLLGLLTFCGIVAYTSSDTKFPCKVCSIVSNHTITTDCKSPVPEQPYWQEHSSYLVGCRYIWNIFYKLWHSMTNFKAK
jgi:hypothetical protein